MFRPMRSRLTHSSRFSRLAIIVSGSVLLILVFVLSACSGNIVPTASAAPASQANTTLTTNTTTSHAATVSQASITSPSGSYMVKVYFSRFPDAATDLNAVFPVNRTSPTIAVGTFAIQLLIAGPTLSERNSGYFSELNSMFTGPSNCSAPQPTGGSDFTLTLNKKGTVAEPGTATLRFCRMTSSPGIGADARVQAQITATLKQFSNIKKVVILMVNGHCFADAIGQDRCLK